MTVIGYEINRAARLSKHRNGTFVELCSIMSDAAGRRHRNENALEKSIVFTGRKQCKNTVRTLCAIAVATVCSPGYVVLASSLASAQIYPSRPVRIVVPFPPGGPLDLIGRAIADRMQADLKQPFIIENKAGAGGNLGSDAVAKSDPDGYTLLLGLSFDDHREIHGSTATSRRSGEKTLRRSRSLQPTARRWSSTRPCR